ncbi:MAG: hypothetical protein NVV62_15560 [Terricaulis sp.]|nr:hypothetical protein [Terricaulis sp.]
MSFDQEAWRLSVDARIAALESALTALAVIKGKDARRALAAALDKAAESAPPERDPAHHAAMQVALRSLAESLRLPDRATDA